MLLLPPDHDRPRRRGWWPHRSPVNGASAGACSADDDGAVVRGAIRPARGIGWVTLISGGPAAGTQPMPLTFRGARIERSAAVR
jgi:hypothetical protein